jgi:tetratricopeptide (TPR) repeat protein
MKLTSKIALVALASTCLPTWGQAKMDPRDTTRLQACIAKIDQNADEAFEDGLVWRSQSGGAVAEQCIALARIAKGDVAAGAAKLAGLSLAPDAGDEEQRALLLAKAANAWLMNGDYDLALQALTRALSLKPEEPDLLIDRARAYAGLGQWSDAQRDLTSALTKRPIDTLIFRLRSEAYLQQGKYSAAEQDANEAMRLAPKDIDVNLVRGRVIEAKRTGRPPQ